MAAGKEIRTKISSIRSTQKITSAMEMVAASKMRRAQERMQLGKPYARRIRAVVGYIANSAPEYRHIYMQERDVRNVGFVVVSTDRGLCGAYNTNIVKYTERMIARRRPDLESVSIISVGRKGAEQLRARRVAPIERRWSGITRVEASNATEISQYLTERYLSGAADEIVLVYSEFISALTQRPGHQVLLPLR